MTIPVITVLSHMRDKPMCGVSLEALVKKDVVYNVYVLLTRLEKEKAIEFMPTFQPAVPGEKRSRPRRWYKITAKGIKMLDDARSAFS